MKGSLVYNLSFLPGFKRGATRQVIPELSDLNSDRNRIMVLFVIVILLLLASGLHANDKSDNKLHSNAAGMEFVFIPGGSFVMGSLDDAQGPENNETPRHNVTLKAFYLQTTEITQAQWTALTGNNPSHFSGDNLPVERVTWDDAQLFLQKLNTLDPGKNYRLPSEAEWEYACRAGTETVYYNGSEECDLDDIAWYGGNSENRTHPAGKKGANPWGLHDLLGNVWEWCEDRYHPDYTGAPDDGSAWLSGESYSRVLRGGSWRTILIYCRCAGRGSRPPEYRSYSLGFRAAYDGR